MRQQRIRERVVSLIRNFAGVSGTLEQRQHHKVPVYVVAVLAVVKERNAVSAFGHIHEFVGAGLELLAVPGSVLVSWTLYGTELDLERSFVRIGKR